MKRSMLCLMGLAALFGAATDSAAEVLLPVTEFQLRDMPLGGGADAILSVEGGGAITNASTFTDETFAEFSLDHGSAPQVTLNLEVRNGSSSARLGEAKDFRVSYYSGAGSADLSLFGTGTFFASLTHPGGGANALDIDVTGIYNDLVTAGASHIGFRFHDAFWALSPTEGSQLFYETSQLDLVPEPSTLVLLSVAATGLVAYAWRRRRIDARGKL